MINYTERAIQLSERNRLDVLNNMRNKNWRIVVGLNSGTSFDGIDAAVVEIEGNRNNTRVKLLAFENIPYPPEIRPRIAELFDPETGRVDRICRMNFVIGELFASAALQIVAKAGLEAEEVDLIGSHGQTIYHLPEFHKGDGIGTGSTLQIGEPAVIAERTGIITVADFRVGDVAAGGQGAPLVAYADHVLFGLTPKVRIIQNIGGIGNLTLVGGQIIQSQVMAFDTGPGNMILDELAGIITDGREHFDRDGKLAGAGKVTQSLLAKLLNHSYFMKTPPKTTGREEFGTGYVRDLYQKARGLGICDEDLMATATAFTVESIAYHYEKYIFPHHRVDEVIVGGGGVYNPTLMEMLRRRLAPVPLLCHEDFGIVSDAKEAIAFAILANETVCGNPSNVPSATGATKEAVLGKIVL